ncbi:MAG: 1-deoxy-D-xylulose-5-phosphate reductoisomerase, partial [Pseudomonadota bacterium]
MKRVVLLGATGSVGTSTVAAVEAGAFQLVGISAQSNVDALCALAERFRPEMTVIGDPAKAGALEARLSPLGLSCAAGPAAVEALAAMDADRVVIAIPGFAALRPALAAAAAGVTICLANKECLVAAGHLVTAAAARSGATILPVDSEHNAIFQVY